MRKHKLHHNWLYSTKIHIPKHNMFISWWTQNFLRVRLTTDKIISQVKYALFAKFLLQSPQDQGRNLSCCLLSFSSILRDSRHRWTLASKVLHWSDDPRKLLKALFYQWITLKFGVPGASRVGEKLSLGFGANHLDMTEQVARRACAAFTKLLLREDGWRVNAGVWWEEYELRSFKSQIYHSLVYSLRAL